MAEFFGYEFKRKPVPESVKSFSAPISDDGAVVVASGGMYGTYIDLDGTIKTEAELVNKYREMSLHPEIDKAINEVVNETVVNEEGKKTVEIILDDLDLSDNLKRIIEEEFDNIVELLDFRKSSYDIFKRWYVDGRSYYHVIIDQKAPAEGIKELRYVDPRKIRKIREVQRKKDPSSEAVLTITKKEYYIYNERGLASGPRTSSTYETTSGLKIEKDSIIQIASGLMDPNNSLVLSFLHPAIKVLNQLRALEDSTIIYHMSRAPERRIFYIDIGNLPKVKAEQHLRDMMTKNKNKLSYDAQTGELRDDRKFMTMLEDYWFPRRDGNRGTEVQILAGGTALPQLLESVQYFRDKLFNSLQVPTTRMNPEDGFNLGRSTEISRDEVNFSKFIDRLRNKFSDIFLLALEKQLILKGITTADDFQLIKQDIRFKYLRDNFFSELKEMEIMTERLARLQAIAAFAGRYVSHTWIRKNVLRQTDEDIIQMDAEIAQEMTMEQYMIPDEEGGMPGPVHSGKPERK